MRAFVLLALVLSVLGSLCGCDGDPTAVPRDTIIGQVRLPDGANAPDGTTVYLTREYLWPGLFFGMVDSTRTGPQGLFTFTGVGEGRFLLMAGVYGSGGASGWSYVSPFSGPVDVPAAEKVDERVRLNLAAVAPGAEIEGVVMGAGDPPAPAEFVPMQLWRLEGPTFALVDSIRTAGDGAFRFTGAWTGSHVVVGNTWQQDGTSPEPIPLAAESPVFFCRPGGTARLDTLWLSDANVDKPAIYIYPDEPGRFSVTLGLGRGVRLTASEPAYGEGWDVFVDAGGRIDGRHDYLFYELRMPSPSLPDAGWCLDGDDLGAGLAALVARCGLNAAETAAFVDYWSERLPDSPYWLARPVFGADLDRWAALAVSPAPDTVLRLWLFFQPSSSSVALPAPHVPPTIRGGTTVVEWGGAVLPRPPV